MVPATPIADYLPHGGVDSLTNVLRSNGGGNDRNGEAVAARSADTQHMYRRIRFRDGSGHGDPGPYIGGFLAPAATQLSGCCAIRLAQVTGRSGQPATQYELPTGD